MYILTYWHNETFSFMSQGEEHKCINHVKKHVLGTRALRNVAVVIGRVVYLLVLSLK